MSDQPIIELRPGYTISRVIRGGWQLAGGHGPVDRSTAIADLAAYYEAGVVTFDCADIYTGVEELIGDFRASYAAHHGSAALAKLRVHTKLVPDLEALASLSRVQIRRSIDNSLRRLRVDMLDLVQFHWWDYNVPGAVEATLWLDELRREGKLLHIGATNFDSSHLSAFVEAGVPLVSMQVQYSLIDGRPEHALVAAAEKHGVWLFCYGTVAGGFLSERWLGVPEPKPPFENRSLTKYKLIIDEFGGWDLFQALLRALADVARRHGTDIASVASRAMLDRPSVAAVIVGARNLSHLARNARIGTFDLTGEDKASIAAVLAERRGPAGDTYELERDRHGRHGSIIKYNLNKAS